MCTIKYNIQSLICVMLRMVVVKDIYIYISSYIIKNFGKIYIIVYIFDPKD